VDRPVNSRSSIWARLRRAEPLRKGIIRADMSSRASKYFRNAVLLILIIIVPYMVWRIAEKKLGPGLPARALAIGTLLPIVVIEQLWRSPDERRTPLSTWLAVFTVAVAMQFDNTRLGWLEPVLFFAAIAISILPWTIQLARKRHENPSASQQSSGRRL
jgi:hypothetical protein